MQEATKSITFKAPIDLDGVSYTKADLCEPTAGQMEKAAAGKSGITYNIILISEVAAIPQAAVRKFRKRDLEACIEYLVGFTNDDQTTGNES